MNNTTTDAACLDSALAYHASGLAITICREKVPVGKAWQHREWTEAEIEAEYRRNPTHNVGAILGPRSNLIDMECDEPGAEDDYKRLFEGCEIAIPPMFTSRRGKHRLFAWDDRLDAVAKLPGCDSPGKGAVVHFGALEVRLGAIGKGAQSLLPPSETGGVTRSWVPGLSLSDCDPPQLPNEVINRIIAAAVEQFKPDVAHESNGTTVSGSRPGDEFNRHGSWDDVFAKTDWVVDHVDGDVVYWRRPGKAKGGGWSASTGHCYREGVGELFYCFSSNAPPFQQEHSYSKFTAYTMLHHPGDFKAAAKGFGNQQSRDDSRSVKAAPERAADPERKPVDSSERKVTAKPDRASEIRRAEEALTELDSLSAEAAFGDAIVAPMATLHRLDRAAYGRHKLRLPEGVNKIDFQAAVRQHPNAQFKTDEKDGLTKVLADLICGKNHFAQDAGGKLFRYVGGVYKPRGEQFVKTQVKQLCEKKGWAAQWTKHQAEEVHEYIRIDSLQLWDRPAEGHINVANGLLNWRTRELKDHSPDHLSVVQLPVKFDPKAKCPNIDKFIGETFPADALDLAYEIPASAMTGHHSIQKAILLTGPGGNGKRRYLTMVKAFLGTSNVSGMSLHRLESDKFATARLYGRLANICPDLPTEHLAGTSVFKAIIDGSGDTITGEHKFKDSFDFTPFCRLMFSANHPPRSQDSSKGFFDRWLVVPFDNRFRGEGGEIPPAKLDAMLSAQSELSGLLNKAIDVVQRLSRDGRFTESETTRAAHREFQSMTDPFSVWISANTIDDPTMYVCKKTLRERYNAHAGRKGLPPMSAKAFTVALLDIRPEGFREAQRQVNNVTTWCWLGIGLKQQEKAETTEQEPSLFE